MEKKKYIRDLYRLQGFRARATLKPNPGDSNGCVITLDRRQKKQLVQFAAQQYPVFGIERCIRCGIWIPEQRTSILNLNLSGLYSPKLASFLELLPTLRYPAACCGEVHYRRVYCPCCLAVKRETLSWLASSARFTQRFEDRIGLLCREMSVKKVAELNDLSWDQVCRMEKNYMRRLMEQHPPSEQLRAIGIDEISVRKGHPDAIVVADLDQRRPRSGWVERVAQRRI